MVMLTKEEEGGQVRCHRYWPEDEDTYGQIKVVRTNEITYPKYILQEFMLSITRVCTYMLNVLYLMYVLCIYCVFSVYCISSIYMYSLHCTYVLCM